MEEQVFGRSIGQYELLSRINRGSISELYKVRSHQTGEIFAMRKILPHLLSDSEARTTFTRGAKIELNLDHPNIVKVFSMETAESGPYVITEFIEGDNLKQWILERQIATLPQALKVLVCLSEALFHVHGQNVIHHDVKPENVLISTDGQVKLTDFSLAVAKKKDYISSKRISGSPSYVAPEIIRFRKYDERVDIYSLGVTAYEVLSGRLPYSGKTSQETLTMHVSRFLRPPALGRLNPDVPVKLEQAVETAMEKSRRRRYPHVSLFLRDIRDVARDCNIDL
jgi:serine/threonine-protein kinase